jgi:hypothetical protein
VLTERGSFQKYFDQAKLRAHLETRLEREALPAGIGTFCNRFRRREILPRQQLAELRLEETRQALVPLMEAIATLGRLPDPTEFAGTQAVVERFGSLRRAFAGDRSPDRDAG